MVTPNKPTLSDARKLAIQADMTRRFPSGVIGQDEEKREEVFAALFDRLIEEYFVLQTADGAPIPEKDEWHVKQIVIGHSLEFYASRKDHLSVTDYVTDFLDIVATTRTLVAVLRE